jgi:hypothetical protein
VTNSDTGGAVSMCFERSSIAVLKLVTCIFKLIDLKMQVEDRIRQKTNGLCRRAYAAAVRPQGW